MPAKSEELQLSSHRARGMLMYGVLLVLAGAVLFLSDSRTLNVYDEGIALSAAMRIVAGQVIHRDFYYNYGPATVYMLAGLFRGFGEYVVVERMFGLFQAATTAVGIYFLLTRHAGRKIAIAGFIGCLIWPEFLSWMTLSMLWATSLVAGTSEGTPRRKSLLLAGLMAGGTFWFRYDVGLGVAIVHVLLIGASWFAAEERSKAALKERLVQAGFYVLGFALLAVPLIAIYAVHGVIHDWMFDIFIYSSKHYHAARKLPFPRVGRGSFEDIVVYFFPLLLLGSLLAGVRLLFQRRSAEMGNYRGWANALIAFSAVGIMMYLKAWVRLGAGTLFLCTANCLVLCAVLFACRRLLPSFGRGLVYVAVLIFAVAGISERRHSIGYEASHKSLMLGWVTKPGAQAPFGTFHEWCNTSNASSKGFCYFPDDDHIRMIEYVEAHTGPGDTLYVGLPRHDRINLDDNVSYFVAQRLPATKWTHFDPFLQNSLPVQAEMVSDLEKNKPPYIVLDSEFDNDMEPNGSSVSTGVELLDEYIRQHYVPAEHFGELTVLRVKK